MSDSDYLEKLSKADTIKDISEKIKYLNNIQDEYKKIKEKKSLPGELSFQDRINNINIKLFNFDDTLFDYALKTKIFLSLLKRNN